MADNAFPSDVSSISGRTGLTKRELIAAMVLQGLATSFYSTGTSPANMTTLTDQKLAADAVMLADALLAKLA